MRQRAAFVARGSLLQIVLRFNRIFLSYLPKSLACIFGHLLFFPIFHQATSFPSRIPTPIFYSISGPPNAASLKSEYLAPSPPAASSLF